MGIRDEAQIALRELQGAICRHLAEHREGLQNLTIARDLGLESDHEGQQKNYLTSRRTRDISTTYRHPRVGEGPGPHKNRCGCPGFPPTRE